jgi:hypothetical protein
VAIRRFDGTSIQIGAFVHGLGAESVLIAPGPPLSVPVLTHYLSINRHPPDRKML